MFINTVYSIFVTEHTYLGYDCVDTQLHALGNFQILAYMIINPLSFSRTDSG